MRKNGLGGLADFPIWEWGSSAGGWSILNFAFFAKFRVGILELIKNQQPPVREKWRSSRNRRHENTKELQEDSVQP